VDDHDTGFVVVPATWQADRTAIEAVRRTVFIDEQQVPEDEEWDEADPHCRHVLALTRNRDAVGTGRLDASGKIGRVAVLKKYRGTGVGGALMRYLVDLARDSGFTQAYLNAQTTAMGFYERLGFRAEGPEFDEAGIPHKRMRLWIGQANEIQAGCNRNEEHPVDAG
jgi:predicted GNAT family N-acyltransferase